MVMVGKLEQGRKGEAGVSVSKLNVGASVRGGFDAPGEAVQVAGSCQAVG